MHLRVASETDVGVVRRNNEDSLLDALPLVAVADGVGGHNAGEIASALAVDVLREWLPQLSSDGGEKLQEAANDANERIYSRAQSATELHGMATTLTAAWIDKGTCTIAHVGDSRAYLLRDGNLRQLTEDHSVVAQLVKEGRITPEDAFEHPWRNLVVQALGGQPDVVVDVLNVDLATGDRLLLCSDGLTDYVRPARIASTLASHTDPIEACRALVETAKTANSRDNITVVLVEVAD